MISQHCPQNQSLVISPHSVVWTTSFSHGCGKTGCRETVTNNTAKYRVHSHDVSGKATSLIKITKPSMNKVIAPLPKSIEFFPVI